MLDKFESDKCREHCEESIPKCSTPSCQQDCCLSNDACNFKDNCSTQCCKGMKCKNSDIEDDECVPIMVNRIFDCICVNSTQFGQDDTISGAPISIIIDNFDPKTMISGTPICIDKISTSVNNVGLLDDSLLFKVGQNSVEFDSLPSPGDLITGYEARVSTTDSCECDYGIKTRISSTGPLIFYGSNLRVIVTGKIGCVPFIGHFILDKQYAINDNLNGIYPMSIFSKLCLPVDNKNISLNLIFNPTLSIDCITPDPSYVISVKDGTASFKVSAEYSFSVDSEIVATIPEKLGVFVTENEIVCKDGNKPCKRNKCK